MSDTINEAKDRITIDMLGGFLFPGWRAGKSCRSPFREEKNNSFSVYANGQKWRDFGTGDGGDPIDFLAKARGLSNADAIREFKLLAGLAPVAVHDKPRTPSNPPRPIAFPSDMHKGSTEECRRLAELRNVCVQAVKLASKRGLLHFGTMADGGYVPAWILTDRDRTNAQARRLDGKPWQSVEGCPKAKTLRGSQAAKPIGIQEAQGSPTIALVEGGPDLLAAMHFAWAEGVEDYVAPVAMFGATLNIPKDALPNFSGKRIRIFPHLDEGGRNAAIRWERQLAPVAEWVDCFSLDGIRQETGKPVQDLNDLTSIHADDFEADRDLWSIYGGAL